MVYNLELEGHWHELESCYGGISGTILAERIYLAWELIIITRYTLWYVVFEGLLNQFSNNDFLTFKSSPACELFEISFQVIFHDVLGIHEL
jgi:hypothetical protein